MIKCYKCKARIKTHLWIEDERVYCSPGCRRGNESQFKKLYQALKK